MPTQWQTIFAPKLAPPMRAEQTKSKRHCNDNTSLHQNLHVTATTAPSHHNHAHAWSPPMHAEELNINDTAMTRRVGTTIRTPMQRQRHRNTKTHYNNTTAASNRKTKTCGDFIGEQMHDSL
jgi:hypothetical protein